MPGRGGAILLDSVAEPGGVMDSSSARPWPSVSSSHWLLMDVERCMDAPPRAQPYGLHVYARGADAPLRRASSMTVRFASVMPDSRSRDHCEIWRAQISRFALHEQFIEANRSKSRLI